MIDLTEIILCVMLMHNGYTKALLCSNDQLKHLGTYTPCQYVCVCVCVCITY